MGVPQHKVKQHGKGGCFFFFFKRCFSPPRSQHQTRICLDKLCLTFCKWPNNNSLMCLETSLCLDDSWRAQVYVHFRICRQNAFLNVPSQKTKKHVCDMDAAGASSTTASGKNKNKKYWERCFWTCLKATNLSPTDLSGKQVWDALLSTLTSQKPTTPDINR